MEKEKLYYVQKEGTEHYSMVGFVMWTDKKHAKKYTLEQAEKLVSSMPAHLGVGIMVEVE